MNVKTFRQPMASLIVQGFTELPESSVPCGTELLVHAAHYRTLETVRLVQQEEYWFPMCYFFGWDMPKTRNDLLKGLPFGKIIGKVTRRKDGTSYPTPIIPIETRGRTGKWIGNIEELISLYDLMSVARAYMADELENYPPADADTEDIEAAEAAMEDLAVELAYEQVPKSHNLLDDIAVSFPFWDRDCGQDFVVEERRNGMEDKQWKTAKRYEYLIYHTAEAIRYDLLGMIPRYDR